MHYIFREKMLPILGIEHAQNGKNAWNRFFSVTVLKLSFHDNDSFVIIRISWKIFYIITTANMHVCVMVIPWFIEIHPKQIEEFFSIKKMNLSLYADSRHAKAFIQFIKYIILKKNEPAFILGVAIHFRVNIGGVVAWRRRQEELFSIFYRELVGIIAMAAQW